MKKNYWYVKTAHSYSGMRRNHPYLWEYIKRFILDSEISSVLEVGCGINPPVRKWVKKYTGIDLNDKTDAIHQDFTTMDLSDIPRHDLLLACGVIEHCNGYHQFLNQVIKLNYNYTLISFFNSLNHEEERIQMADYGIFVCGYVKAELKKTLTDLNLRHQIINLGPRDDVLIIIQESKNGS